jgi:hypothetical protein
MAEDPIIVSGNSLSVEFPAAFSPNTSAPPGRQKYTQMNYTMLRIEVNGVEVAKLGDNDEVRIICDNGQG